MTTNSTVASGESSKCPSCSKSVYHAEELLCSGVSWHKGCFKCGGSGELGCQRKLNLSDFTLDSSVPFCKACYMKLLAKPVLATESTVIGASSGSDRSEITDLQGLVKIAERRLSFGAANKGTAVGTASVGMTKLACPKCSKTVYKAEEITLAGFSWHKSCFTCGGASEDDGCKRTLTQNDFHSHRGNPFCKSCIGKQPILDKKRSELGLTRSETDPSASANEDATIIIGSGPTSSEVHVASEALASSTSTSAPEVAAEEGTVDADTKKSSAAATDAVKKVVTSTEPTAAPVEAVVAVATVPAMATVLSVNGKESERSNPSSTVENSGSEEKDDDIDDAMTTYQDEDGVPCTKDGEPLLGPEVTSANMDPVMAILGAGNAKPVKRSTKVKTFMRNVFRLSMKKPIEHTAEENGPHSEEKETADLENMECEVITSECITNNIAPVAHHEDLPLHDDESGSTTPTAPRTRATKMKTYLSNVFSLNKKTEGPSTSTAVLGTSMN